MLTHVSIVNFGVQKQSIALFKIDSNCNNWVCPPRTLILSVLKHMEFWKASGVLVVRELKPTSF